VSLRIVLADGSVKEVSAESDDPDLWWALQGAGHNFGIVTSVTAKIYDGEVGDIWSYESYYFTHDKDEGLYECINTLWPDGSQPSDVINYSVIMRNPDVDPNKVRSSHFASIFLFFLFLFYFWKPSLPPSYSN
jgi:hypothetical protein